jgi:hypothetical protein
VNGAVSLQYTTAARDLRAADVELRAFDQLVKPHVGLQLGERHWKVRALVLLREHGLEMHVALAREDVDLIATPI